MLIYAKHFMTMFKMFILIFIIVEIVYLIKYIYSNIQKYVFTHEINFEERYGANTWVLITGCSSGQGQRFAYEFAKRNFNIILVGNKKILNVENDIKKRYNVKTRTCITNFCKAYKKSYFDKIDKLLNNLDGELSILVNNVGHRTAWQAYHMMPTQTIIDTIVCGTVVQSLFTHIAINHFEKRDRKYKSCIINITAMCLTPPLWVGVMNHISVPYLSVYESANAFGFFHSNSIQKEYEDHIDVLNITPAAVITENTQYLEDTLGSVNCKHYVKNIFKLIGNYTGPQHAYWKHELFGFLSNFIDADTILYHTGKLVSENYMTSYNFKNSTT
jgi:short-subunit dehydrogenase